MSVERSWLELVVTRREQMTPEIVALDLMQADGGELPAFDAGAHVDVRLRGETVRSYSLCGDPLDRSRYRLGILRDPASRGGSVSVHRDLHVGTKVFVTIPSNNFPLNLEAPYSVLIGGGIGITPLMSMAWTLSARRSDFALHYCTRSRPLTAFVDELKQSPFHTKICLHFDDGAQVQRFRADLLPDPKSGAHLYVCGPVGFMDWVIGLARERGYAECAIHREYFSAEIDRSGASFEVELASTGQRVTVVEGQSIVQALATIGIKVQVSCESGVCGTCLTGVCAGIPDHRDLFLTDEEHQANDQITLCCSRARSSRLVLDL
jgi:vanillate O-demethylase ferredoxin subunit